MRCRRVRFRDRTGAAETSWGRREPQRAAGLRSRLSTSPKSIRARNAARSLTGASTDLKGAALAIVQVRFRAGSTIVLSFSVSRKPPVGVPGVKNLDLDDLVVAKSLPHVLLGASDTDEPGQPFGRSHRAARGGRVDSGIGKNRASREPASAAFRRAAP